MSCIIHPAVSLVTKRPLSLTEGAFEEMVAALGNVDVETRVRVLQHHLEPPLLRRRGHARLQPLRYRLHTNADTSVNPTNRTTQQHKLTPVQSKKVVSSTACVMAQFCANTFYTHTPKKAGSLTMDFAYSTCSNVTIRFSACLTKAAFKFHAIPAAFGPSSPSPRPAPPTYLPARFLQSSATSSRIAKGTTKQ